MAQPENATFHTFKRSGKWAYSGRGFAAPELFNSCFNGREYHERILQDNGGTIPGMSGNGVGYFIVAVPDEAVPYGWPLHIDAIFNQPSTRFTP